MTSVPVLCRSCGDSIKFVKTQSGKTMPVNTDPDPEGSLILETDVSTSEQVVIHVGRPNGENSFSPTRYTSHFATCPEVFGWRKRRHATRK